MSRPQPLPLTSYAPERYLQYGIMYCILQRNDGQKVLHTLLRRSSSPLTPHLLIQVGLQIFSLDTSSHFLSQFKVVPARLNLLCMHPRHWVYKVSTVNNSSVCGDVVYLAIHISIGGPVIGMDFRSGSDAP